MTHDWTEDDIANLELKGTVEVEWQTPTGEKPDRMNDAWTQTEIDFATEHLEPQMAIGNIIAWWPQVKFRLPFMTYTADFAALVCTGELGIYEIKGNYRLPSAGRSNTAIRALNYFIDLPEVRVVRVTRKDDGSWKFKTITNKRQNGPHTRAEVKDD